MRVEGLGVSGFKAEGSVRMGGGAGAALGDQDLENHLTWTMWLSQLFFRKVDIRLAGRGNSNSHGARPAY